MSTRLQSWAVPAHSAQGQGMSAHSARVHTHGQTSQRHPWEFKCH